MNAVAPVLRLLPEIDPAPWLTRHGRRSRPARAGLPSPLPRSPRGGRPPSLPRPHARRGRRRRRRLRRHRPIPTTPCDAWPAGGARRRRSADPAGGDSMSRSLLDLRPRDRAHRPVMADRGHDEAPGPRPGRRARRGAIDPTAPSLVAGAEVRRHEQHAQSRSRPPPCWWSPSSPSTCCPASRRPRRVDADTRPVSDSGPVTQRHPDRRGGVARCRDLPHR